MQSLYGRLFRYRERPNRTPLEDYLSECLADFFNRLPHEAKVGFVQELFLPAACATEWRALIAGVGAVAMKTQYQIPNGRLDIVVLLDEQPSFVIENKIAAPIAKRSNDTDQLTAYGNWLKKTADASGRKLAVLCLLTHVTQPPETFTDNHKELYGANPRVVTWSQIAHELRAIAAEGRLPLDVCTIAREFHQFLLEQNMTSEFANLEDFAAAIVYVRSGSRILHTFEKIFDHLSELGGPFVEGRIKDDEIVDFESGSNVIHGWKYLSAAPLRTAYFTYGISLQPRRALSKDTLPDEDSIFLGFGVETKREMQLLETMSKDLGEGWHCLSSADSSVMVTFRPLHIALAQPDQFANTMIAWIDQSHAVVTKAIRTLQKKYEQ